MRGDTQVGDTLSSSDRDGDCTNLEPAQTMGAFPSGRFSPGGFWDVIQYILGPWAITHLVCDTLEMLAICSVGLPNQVFDTFSVQRCRDFIKPELPRGTLEDKADATIIKFVFLRQQLGSRLLVENIQLRLDDASSRNE